MEDIVIVDLGILSIRLARGASEDPDFSTSRYYAPHRSNMTSIANAKAQYLGSLYISAWLTYIDCVTDCLVRYDDRIDSEASMLP